MKSFAFVVIIASIFLQINTAPFEVDKSYLRVPPEIETARLIYEGSEFKMILGDEKTYTFKLESLDPHLRFVNLDTLLFSLGMAWKFDSEKIMLASEYTSIDKLQQIGYEFNFYSNQDPMFGLAMESRPSSGYLQVYKLDNGGYGLHIHPAQKKGSGLLATLWSWIVGNDPDISSSEHLVIGYAVIPPVDDTPKLDFNFGCSDDEPRLGESRKAFERRMENKKH